MTKLRSISSEIRLSQSFAKLTLRQRDLWHGLIAIADDQGRLPGLPAAIRSMVWPYDDIHLSDVSEDLEALSNSENIIIYCQNGGTYIQIIKWWDYQKMQWAGASKYPAPVGWLDRERYHGKGRKIITNNWNTPGGFFISTDNDKVNVNDEVKDNDNPLSKSQTTKVDDKGSGDVFAHYQNNIGFLSPYIQEAIIDYLNDCPDTWLIEAINISVENGVRKWSYIKAILDRWLADGKTNGKKKTSEAPAVRV